MEMASVAFGLSVGFIASVGVGNALATNLLNPWLLFWQLILLESPLLRNGWLRFSEDFMVLCVKKDAKNEQKESTTDTLNIFSERVARIRKNLPFLMASGALIALACNAHIFAGSDFSCEALIIEEVKQMMEWGVQTVVEVTCNDMGRDVNQLLRISEACDLNIVCATGFYLWQYHPEHIRVGDAKAICDIFCRDIQEGIDSMGVKAGVIGEVASGQNEIAPSERKVLSAAGMASIRTGLAVTTHCQMGMMAFEQSLLQQGEGMDPDKIIVGHLDLADDRAYYSKVLETGVNIGFVTGYI